MSFFFARPAPPSPPSRPAFAAGNGISSLSVLRVRAVSANLCDVFINPVQRTARGTSAWKGTADKGIKREAKGKKKSSDSRGRIIKYAFAEIHIYTRIHYTRENLHALPYLPTEPVPLSGLCTLLVVSVETFQLTFLLPPLALAVICSRARCKWNAQDTEHQPGSFKINHIPFIPPNAPRNVCVNGRREDGPVETRAWTRPWRTLGVMLAHPREINAMEQGWMMP